MAPSPCGEKLHAALQAFDIDPSGLTCADVGASTGGFTDCLLQHNALRVYAIDVGHGILHWKLRQDPRVVVMERTNARFVEMLPEAVDLVTVDVSYILKVLPRDQELAQQGHRVRFRQRRQIASNGSVIALTAFSAGRFSGASAMTQPSTARCCWRCFARQQGFGCGLLRSPWAEQRRVPDLLVYPERELLNQNPRWSVFIDAN
jgi:hypothetical protein